jgi:hypothetical protein
MVTGGSGGKFTESDQIMSILFVRPHLGLRTELSGQMTPQDRARLGCVGCERTWVVG